jgi:hypothetical protein
MEFRQEVPSLMDFGGGLVVRQARVTLRDVAQIADRALRGMETPDATVAAGSEREEMGR